MGITQCACGYRRKSTQLKKTKQLKLEMPAFRLACEEILISNDLLWEMTVGMRVKARMMQAK
jgi:hypothetical protein